MSVNKVIIVGNLGADPEVHQFNNGGMVANVSIATTERWNDRQTGERKEHTEWHRVVFSNRLAEIVQQYLRKGSQIYVEGSIRTRKWQDQNGQDRYSTEIRANNMQMLGSNPNAGMGGQIGGQMGGGYQPQGYQNQGGYQNQQPNSFGQGGQSNNQMGNQMAQQGNGQQNGQQMGAMNGNTFNNQTPPQQPATTPKPTEMAMTDAPVDDDIPF